MSKKSKKNIQQLIEKKRQLQLLQKQNSADSALPTELMSQPSSTVLREVTAVVTNTNSGVGRELVRTLISVLIITGLLIGFVAVDKRTTAVKRAGEWLYQTLRLSS